MAYWRGNHLNLFFVTLDPTFMNFNPSAPTPQNGQTYSNNSSAVANEIFECV